VLRYICDMDEVRMWIKLFMFRTSCSYQGHGSCISVFLIGTLLINNKLAN
jgi:hypothetical protein